jgi:hypothetical protein
VRRLPLCELCEHPNPLGFGPEHVLMVFADASTGADGGHLEFSDT